MVPEALRKVKSSLKYKPLFKLSVANRYFVAYEWAKKALTPPGSDPSQLNLSAIIIAGGTAGVAMWSIAIPPDVSSL
jgi:hypothetical protein